MQESLVKRIADWSEGKLPDEALLDAVEASRPDLERHRQGFQGVIDDLIPVQRERCESLIEFCFQVLESIAEALDQICDCVESEDKNGVFIAGDTVARASFQLNQAFAELNNQALVALGPTDIPNLNLLLHRRDEYLKEPNENTQELFQEAIDCERIVVYEGMQALAKEPDLPEVSTLINAFRAHMKSLNRLAESLERSGPEADYEGMLTGIGMKFMELKELVPVVQMKLRCHGETDYPDINYLLKLMADVAEGKSGDGPLLLAMEAVDEAFNQSRETLDENVEVLDSALASDEVENTLVTYDEFDEAMEAIDKFLEERDKDWLVEARGCLLEFAKKLSQHQKSLEKIEQDQGKVQCPRCACANETGRSRCEKCGMTLPQNMAFVPTSTFDAKEKTEGSSEEPLITANIEKLYEAVNLMAAGEIDSDTFFDALDRFENVIEANVGQVPPEPEVDDSKEQSLVELLYDTIEAGIEKLRDGLDMMRTYPETGNQERLAEGVRLIDEGAKLVQISSGRPLPGA